MRQLTEGGINSILKHGKDGMVIISASRSGIEIEGKDDASLANEYEQYLSEKGLERNEETEQAFLDERNSKCDEELKNTLRESPFSFSQVYGGYKRDDMTDEYEPSFIIYAHDKGGNVLPFNTLFEFAMDMGVKYKQDSVFVQEPNNPPNFIDPRTRQQENTTSSNTVKINRQEEPFFTTTKRSKATPNRFTSDIRFENVSTITVGSLQERMRNSRKYGQIFL